MLYFINSSYITYIKPRMHSSTTFYLTGSSEEDSNYSQKVPNLSWSIWGRIGVKYCDENSHAHRYPKLFENAQRNYQSAALHLQLLSIIPHLFTFHQLLSATFHLPPLQQRKRYYFHEFQIIYVSESLTYQ